MLNKRLFKSAGFRKNLLSCINNSILQTQKEIQISQAEIRIQNCCAFTQLGQGYAEIGGEGGFANPPLP